MRVVSIAALGLLAACSSWVVEGAERQFRVGSQQLSFGHVVLGSVAAEKIELINVGRSHLNVAALDVPEGFEVSPELLSLDGGARAEVR